MPNGSYGPEHQQMMVVAQVALVWPSIPLHSWSCSYYYYIYQICDVISHVI